MALPDGERFFAFQGGGVHGELGSGSELQCGCHIGTLFLTGVAEQGPHIGCTAALPAKKPDSKCRSSPLNPAGQE